MFCPKCATQNLEGASFCRSCGANISLIPQALSGQPLAPEVDESCSTRRFGKRRTLNLDHSFKNIFMGIAFLIVAIALSRSIGAGWWFWMLLPAFSMMGTGVAQYIRIKEQQKRSVTTAPTNQTFVDGRNYAPPRNIAPPRPGEMRAPVPSVTEGTTRHLGVESPARHFDAEPK